MNFIKSDVNLYLIRIQLIIEIEFSKFTSETYFFHYYLLVLGKEKKIIAKRLLILNQKKFNHVKNRIPSCLNND